MHVLDPQTPDTAPVAVLDRSAGALLTGAGGSDGPHGSDFASSTVTLLLANLPDVTVGVVDDRLVLREVAGRWLHRTSMSATDVVGRQVVEFTGPELLERIEPALRAALSGSGASMRLRNPVASVDPGAPSYIEFEVRPYRSDPGRPQALWLLRDVSGEHEPVARAPLDDRAHLAGELVGEYATFLVDVAGRITAWSETAEQLTDFPADEVLGRPFALLYPDAARAGGAAARALAAVVATGVHREETWQRRRDGSPLWCQIVLKALPHSHDDPEVPGYLCVLRDLTEQRRNRAELAASHRMYRAAFDDAPSGMALVEHREDGSTGWQVLEANAALAELIGQPVAVLTDPRTRLLAEFDEPAGGLRDVFDGGATRFETSLITARGERRRVVVRMSALEVDSDDAVGIVRFVAQFDDVTGRRRAVRAAAEAIAAEQAASRTLRELQRQRQDFLDTVSHELRTPLASVLGYVELFDDGDLGPLSDDQAHALRGIGRNATRLRDLVSDLLVVSAIDDGAARAGACDTPVDRAVAEARSRTVALLLERGHELVVRGERDTRVAIDPELFVRVLTALLGNAAKFTSPGGLLELDVRREDDVVVCSVSDDGVGIPPDELERVFDAFYRSSRASASAASGTGLGLSLVRRIVEMYGGAVSVTSEPGRRTTFTVRLPVPEVGARA